MATNTRKPNAVHEANSTAADSFRVFQQGLNAVCEYGNTAAIRKNTVSCHPSKEGLGAYFLPFFAINRARSNAISIACS